MSCCQFREPKQGVWSHIRAVHWGRIKFCCYMICANNCCRWVFGILKSKKAVCNRIWAALWGRIIFCCSMTYLLSTSLKGNYSLKYFKIGCKSENKRFIIDSLVVVSYICFKESWKRILSFVHPFLTLLACMMIYSFCLVRRNSDLWNIFVPYSEHLGSLRM